MKILVVDDCKAICDVTAMLLRDRGMDVSVAYDAAAAYELLLARHYDVVVTDYYTERGAAVSAPGIARTAKAFHPGVRVIITAGFWIEPTCLPGCDFVCKPFHIDAILELIGKWAPRPASERTGAEGEENHGILLPIPA